MKIIPILFILFGLSGCAGAMVDRLNKPIIVELRGAKDSRRTSLTKYRVSFMEFVSGRHLPRTGLIDQRIKEKESLVWDAGSSQPVIFHEKNISIDFRRFKPHLIIYPAKDCSRVLLIYPSEQEPSQISWVVYDRGEEKYLSLKAQKKIISGYIKTDNNEEPTSVKISAKLHTSIDDICGEVL